MNTDETSVLLGMLASHDKRTVGDIDVELWTDALEDLDFRDVANALRAFIRDSDGWCKPSHLRALVRAAKTDQHMRALPVSTGKVGPMPPWFRELYLKHRALNAGRYAPGAPAVVDGYDAMTGRWSK